MECTLEMNVSFTGGGNRSTRRKPSIYGKQLTNFHIHGLCPVPVPNPDHSGVKPADPRRHESNALAHSATEAPGSEPGPQRCEAS